MRQLFNVINNLFPKYFYGTLMIGNLTEEELIKLKEPSRFRTLWTLSKEEN